MQKSSQQIRQLQDCINNLVSLSALPSMWAGQNNEQVLSHLLEVLLILMDLDFAYAEINNLPGITQHEFLHAADKLIPVNNISEMLSPWLHNPHAATKKTLHILDTTDTIYAARTRLGWGSEWGTIVVASSRVDFPDKFDLLLFKTAVNQAIIEIQRKEMFEAQQQKNLAEKKNNQLIEENALLRQTLHRGFDQDEIIGRSEVLKQVICNVEHVAPTNACVLIQGETGTGKELIASSIHHKSTRKNYPFVKLNCASIPTGLLEAELFGHEKGAFTSAIGKRLGRFEMAHQGTLFLDEIAEIPLELQSKLLRVLQELEFERLGSSKTIQVDVRLIAATNRNLSKMVDQGDFRSDLFYRLNVFPVILPALRERKEDIPLLANYFVQQMAQEYNKTVNTIPENTLQALIRYPWPGNIRELANVIERGVILSYSPTLEIPYSELSAYPSLPANQQNLATIERQHIITILNQCNWVIAGPNGAAQKLGMKRTTLQSKMQKLGISKPL